MEILRLSFKNINWTEGVDYCFYCVKWNEADLLFATHPNITGYFGAWPATISMIYYEGATEIHYTTPIMKGGLTAIGKFTRNHWFFTLSFTDFVYIVLLFTIIVFSVVLYLSNEERAQYIYSL